METIKIKASTEYDIIIGKGIIEDICKNLKQRSINGKALIVTDKNVGAIYGEKVIRLLSDGGFSCQIYTVDGGETSKSATDFINICEFLAENKYTRSDFLIALGGGVVGDLTGFVASSYLRGVKFIQVPTTLLAMVDSSVGGKTAINLQAGKNLVGAFYQPSLVVCDLNMLSTLNEREFSCGMAEVIKYGMVFSESLIELLKENDEKNLQKIISTCIKLKKQVVENDEFDKGVRMLLNFGHTLGHAIEKLSNYTISHGQAVGVGMCLITKASINNSLCGKDVIDILEELLKIYKLSNESNFSIKDMYNITLVDKKNMGDKITIVVPTKVGKCQLKTISLIEWKEFLK